MVNCLLGNAPESRLFNVFLFPFFRSCHSHLFLYGCPPECIFIIWIGCVALLLVLLGITHPMKFVHCTTELMMANAAVSDMVWHRTSMLWPHR